MTVERPVVVAPPWRRGQANCMWVTKSPGRQDLKQGVLDAIIQQKWSQGETLSIIYDAMTNNN